jgi:hypothetical protein
MSEEGKEGKEEKDNTNIINMDFSHILQGENNEEPVEEEEDDQIYEVKEYCDTAGRRVKAMIPHGVEDGVVEFHGSFHVQSPMGPIPLVIDFPPDFELEQCFEAFDAQAEKRVEELEKEMEERSRIMTPDQVLNPNGNPIQ